MDTSNQTIKRVKLHTSSTANFSEATQVGDFTLLRYNVLSNGDASTGRDSKGQVFDLTQTEARYVRLEIVNHYTNGGVLGFGEIAFGTGVSEPANSAPEAVCKDIELSASAIDCSATISAVDVDGGSSDPDGDAVVLSISNSGPFPVGVHQVTLTATDPSGETDSCIANVTVIDTTAPVIALNGNSSVTLECWLVD